MLRHQPRFSTLCAVTCLLGAMLVAAGSIAGERRDRELQSGESRTLTVREMAAAYRVQAYLKHHHDRETYQLHRKAAGEMLARWKAAGSPETVEVLAWFQNGRQAAIAGQAPPQALELPAVTKEKLVESKPQPETKPAPSRTRPASITKPAEPEQESTLPSPEPIVPPGVYEEGETFSESTEANSLEIPALESEGSPSQGLEANDPEATTAPDKSSARKGSKSESGAVQSTVKAFLRAVMPERD